MNICRSFPQHQLFFLLHLSFCAGLNCHNFMIKLSPPLFNFCQFAPGLAPEPLLFLDRPFDRHGSFLGYCRHNCFAFQ